MISKHTQNARHCHKQVCDFTDDLSVKRAPAKMTYYQRPYEFGLHRLPSGLFFRMEEAEQARQPPPILSRKVEEGEIAHQEVIHDAFVVPEYQSTEEGKELYIPLLEVSLEVEAVGTVAWTKLTQTFTNRATHQIKEATYCFPLYDKSTITAFKCTIGSDKILKGTVKPKPEAKAQYKEAVTRQCVAALLEEHTPEVFETSIGNIPAQTIVKIEICYITELKADLSGDGILVTIPTSVAPRYGAAPSTISGSASKYLAVPPDKGLEIQIQVSSPVEISKIESMTHPVAVEIGSHGYTTTRNIKDLGKKHESPAFDPRKARATLSDRSACLGRDFVLLIHSRGGGLLSSRAIMEPHPKIPSRSALMVSINLRDMFTPNVIAPQGPREIIFLADRSGSMRDKIEALKSAMGFFLKSLPNSSVFNICSFGSSYVLMWPKSRPYTQNNVDAALSYIATTFRADLGDTELLSALRHAVQIINPAFNTEIITLTDGQIWDTQNTFNFIKETRASGPKDKIRFFALGVGEAVSHQLIEGIGRYGGGLATVVPIDYAGDWGSRVIRMLEAALTPSTWKVEINLNDNTIASSKGKERVYTQAPHSIPDFHAFSRSSVYFILDQHLDAKSVEVKATASSGESVTVNLPIEKLDSTRTYVHLLAVKAVLGDLESGQSWLHDNSSHNLTRDIKTEVVDLARTKGERLGTEWCITSKWTSFVIVDDTSHVERPSFWYQAEKSDLADLTRPKLGANNYSFNTSNIVYGDRNSRTCCAPPSSKAMNQPRQHLSRQLSPDIGGTTASYSSLADCHFPPLSVLDIPDTPDVPGIPQSFPEPPLRNRLASCAGNQVNMDAYACGGLSLDDDDTQIASSTLPQLSARPPVHEPIKDITLQTLIDAQTAYGGFNLSDKLRALLRSKFRSTMPKISDAWFDLVSRIWVVQFSSSEILDTAMPIVWIEVKYAESHGLWKSVVQKARGFLKSIFPSEDHMVELFSLLRGELWNGNKDGKAESDPEERGPELSIRRRSQYYVR